MNMGSEMARPRRKGVPEENMSVDTVHREHVLKEVW